MLINLVSEDSRIWVINGTQNKTIFHSLLHIFSSFSTPFHFIKKLFAFNKLNDKLNISVRYFSSSMFKTV